MIRVGHADESASIPAPDDMRFTTPQDGSMHESSSSREPPPVQPRHF